MNERSKHDSFNLSGSVFLITSDGRTLNLPIPSESPCDPLNWSSKKRALALLSIGLYSYVGLVVTQGASLTAKGLAQEFPYEQTKPFTIESLITAPTLFMGIGAFLWVPLSCALGRRPVFVIAAVLMLLASLAAGVSKSYYQLLACVSVLGLTEGFSLSCALLMIIDLTFIHQRPSAIAMVWSVVGSFNLASLSSVPFITDHGMEWRRFFLYWSIPAGINCLTAFIFFPETYFKRPIVAFDGLTILQSATEKLTIYEDDALQDSDVSVYNKDLPSVPDRTPLRAFFAHFCLCRSTFASWKSMLLCYPQIAFCFFNPLIFWVVLNTAANFAGMMFIGATYAMVLGSPPYSLPSKLIINVNNTASVGSLIAWPLSGPLVCYILKRLSRRNKGVREAEHYLIGYILPVLAGALSTLIYGFAVHYKWHFAAFCLSYGLNAFSFSSISIANTLWVTEAFPRWAAPALVVVGGGSYIASFVMSIALVPWIAKQGYLLVGAELTVLQVVLGMVAVPAAFWGKGVRQRIHARWAERREGALRPL
ncbi:MFS general substrate transporter [Zopfia rhizophila CBS 207.26]|uniref:MFS general substrate transporter n=1 Tax=Zopfia rhizophila CBS 207.26 TaxID=1314779 RepID=A0A6A6E0J1_9PEZI|nr:MFS general substrate transporter [Zopfia rhizophila CBS 207.26]